MVSAGYRKQRRRGIWQPRFMEHTIRDQSDLTNHADYLHYNLSSTSLPSRQETGHRRHFTDLSSLENIHSIGAGRIYRRLTLAMWTKISLNRLCFSIIALTKLC